MKQRSDTQQDTEDSSHNPTFLHTLQPNGPASPAGPSNLRLRSDRQPLVPVGVDRKPEVQIIDPGLSTELGRGRKVD